MSLTQLQQLESTWESEMQTGNSYFKSSAYSKAYSHFMDAMVLSEVLMEDLPTSLQHAIKVPAMYYTACINLAHNYLSMQDIENAASYFLYCTYKLKLLSDKPGAEVLLKQTAAVYWLKAVNAYKEFSDKTGTPIPLDLNDNETYEQLQKLKHLFNMPKEKLN